MSDTIDGSLLRSVTRQVEKGGLDKSLEAAFDKGDKQSFVESAKSMGVTSELLQQSQQQEKDGYSVTFKKELMDKAKQIAEKAVDKVKQENTTASQIPKTTTAKPRSTSKREGSHL